MIHKSKFVPMIVIPGSSRYVKFLPKITKEENLPQKAEILHTVPRRSTNVYPWWLLNFWDPWFSQFVFCISSSRTSTLRPWCGVVAARDLARVGCGWGAKQQLSQDDMGGWSIALFGSSYVLDLTLPSQHCPIVTFMVQVCQRLGFPVPRSGGSLWPSTSSCLWSG